MAVENRVFLNGQIRSIRKAKKDDETVQITIGLFVIRRPRAISGNRAGDIRSDVVLIMVRDKDMISYLENKKAAAGDMLGVCGVYSTLHGMKSYYCKRCGTKNTFEGALSFVTPLCIEVKELNPKKTEVVNLTELERFGTKDEIMDILKSRKTFPGEILSIEDLGKTAEGVYSVRLTVREKPTDKAVLDWLQWMSEMSNRIYIMGNVCAEPVYNPIENGGRVCTYQLGINRKVYIKEDDPSVRADFPWVKSLGDQADMDHAALMKGSLVFIDGSIQARDDFLMEKKCDNCGEISKVKGQAMEIVPYSVEYLRNCLTSSEEEEEYEFDDDFDDEFTVSYTEEEDGQDPPREGPYDEDENSYE